MPWPHQSKHMTYPALEEKPPTSSLFELGKRKNVNETYKKFPEFALWLIWETIHTVSHQLNSQFWCYCQGRWHMKHSWVVLHFVTLPRSFWKLLCSGQNHYANCTVFSKDMTNVFALCLTLWSHINQNHAVLVCLFPIAGILALDTAQLSMCFPSCIIAAGAPPRKINTTYGELLHSKCCTASVTCSLPLCKAAGHSATPNS